MQERKKQKRREDKRTGILAAAKLILEREGIDALSMRRLADELGLNPATVYFYFKSKEDLVRQACDDLYVAMAEEQSPLLRIKDPRRRLTQLCSSYVRLARQDPRKFRLLFLEPVVRHIDAEPRLEKGNPAQDPYANFLAAVRETLLQLGADASETEVRRFAQVVWALGHGAACLDAAFAGDSWFQIANPERIFREGLALLLDGYGKKGKPRC